MLDRERIILLAEEKVYSLLNKDWTEFTEEDREYAQQELTLRRTHRESYT